MAFARAASSPGATSTPQPLGIALGRPPTAVATIGSAHAIASGTTSGNPSVRDESTNRSNDASKAGTSRRTPVNVTYRESDGGTARSTSARASPEPTSTRRTRSERRGTIARTRDG